MSLTLGRQGGVAQPLRKRTVGQTNIAHVYDGTNANNGTTQNQQVPTQGIWDAIDAEIAPFTQEQQNMLLNNQDYVNNYNALQSSDSSLFYLSKF